MTDDDVFEAVRRLVADGEYRDDILGTPGTRLGGRLAVRPSRARRPSARYQRGSPEHLEARASGDTERLPPLVPATPAAVEEAEARRWGFDPNPGEDELDFFRETTTLTEWLGHWVIGRLSQPAGMEDPRTGEWRGATADEVAAGLEDA